MKAAFIVGVFIVFAFANQITGAIDITAKVQKKVDEIIGELPEPIELNESEVHLNNLDATLNGVISGLKGLTVNSVTAKIFPLSINFDFVLPKLNVNLSSYEIDGKLGLLHIFGKGEILLNLENVVIKGSGKLGSTFIDGIQYLNIKSLNLDVSLDQKEFNFKITGWLNDEIRSKFITKLINDMVENMTPEAKPEFDKLLSGLLAPLIAGFKIPYKDIMKP